VADLASRLRPRRLASRAALLALALGTLGHAGRAQAAPEAAPLEAPYLAGDVVAWRLDSGLHHVGVVASRTATGGTHPLAVHNIGAGAQTEDVLHAFVKLGHYRW
jgi:uncharacterized protein YijF (DUF1287 family)